MASLPPCCRNYNCEQSYPKCKKTCIHYLANYLAFMDERQRIRKRQDGEILYRDAVKNMRKNI